VLVVNVFLFLCHFQDNVAVVNMQARHSRPSCATSVFVVPHFTVGYFPELTCRNLLSFMNVEEVLSYSLSYDNVDAT